MDLAACMARALVSDFRFTDYSSSRICPFDGVCDRSFDALHIFMFRNGFLVHDCKSHLVSESCFTFVIYNAEISCIAT